MTPIYKLTALTALNLAISAPLAAAPTSNNAQDFFATSGMADTASPVVTVGPTGNVWNNGGANGINGYSSERNTIISGTGGPEGDHAATVANDFTLAALTQITEIRVCLYHNGTTAELYLYNNDPGTNQPTNPVTAPLFGAPITGSVVSSTFVDNTTTCPNNFGFPGREYTFNSTTTGTPFPVLAPGTYWLAVVGEGGNRAFWATSNGPGVATLNAQFGSTLFGAPYWTDAPTFLGSPAAAEFAFQVDGAAAIPAVAPAGLAALAGLLGLLGLRRLRRRAA